MSEGTRFRGSLDAQQLADALRTRYTSRREQPDADELSADLQRLGDIESIPAVAKPGLTAGPMKAARAVLRVLLRPWLAVQTQTNHEVARRLQRLSSHVSHLLRRTPEMEESLRHFEARLRAVEGRHTPPAAGPSVEPQLADLERMFIHMHLGRPPARVLLIGAAESLAAEVAAFGFDVASTPVTTALYDTVIAVPDEEGRQGSIDEVTQEAARRLRPGGMLLGAWRGDAVSAGWSSCRPLFEPRVVLIGERSGGGWKLREHVPAAPGGHAEDRPRSNVMIQALRLDAPGR